MIEEYLKKTAFNSPALFMKFIKVVIS